MDGHVAKPIEVSKLYNAIEAAMAAARLGQAGGLSRTLDTR